MFESAGAIGPKHWIGRNARNNAEKWVKELIEKVRQGTVTPPENTALYKFSWHRELDGNLLDIEIATVEVINILRPIVAIAIFINFIALAVHHYPEEREKLQIGDEKYAEMFIQEVRRFYPFFPFVVALVKKDFTWKDYQFEEGTLTLLDLYGTNHDPKIWDNHDVFNPARFTNWQEREFTNYVLIIEHPILDKRLRRQLKLKIEKQLPFRLNDPLIEKQVISNFEVMDLKEWGARFPEIVISEVQ